MKISIGLLVVSEPIPSTIPVPLNGIVLKFFIPITMSLDPSNTNKTSKSPRFIEYSIPAYLRPRRGRTALIITVSINLKSLRDYA